MPAMGEAKEREVVPVELGGLVVVNKEDVALPRLGVVREGGVVLLAVVREGVVLPKGNVEVAVVGPNSDGVDVVVAGVVEKREWVVEAPNAGVPEVKREGDVAAPNEGVDEEPTE